MNKNKHLLLLKIEDQEFNELFFGIQEIVNIKKSKLIPHVTLRGPYIHEPKNDQIQKIAEDILDGEPLKIEGAGIFNNNGTYYVYLKVNKSNLKKVFWKKDYPIKEYGFNPHITIYQGTDKSLANKLLHFLDAQNFHFECKNITLSSYILGDKQRKIDFEYSKLRNPKDYINDNKHFSYALFSKAKKYFHAS